MWSAPCYLCRETVGTKHIRGFHVCSQCCYIYESLVHVVRVRPDNPHVAKALQLADDKLDKLEILGALTHYAAEHWKDEKEDD